jgi:nicotinamide riboside transporter PnuC
MTRILRWGAPDQPPPKRPYRDSVILYAVLAVVIVVVAWLTGGGVARAVVFAVLFFVVATAWSVWKWRERLRAEAQRAESGEDALP